MSPPILQSRQPLLLVLDLDETLVRVKCQGIHRARKAFDADFCVLVDIGLPEKVSCEVAVRPGLEDFMRWIQDRRQAGAIKGPWLFTAAMPDYTEAVLREIDPGGHVFEKRVLTREACCESRMPGFLFKDLNVVPPSGGEDGCSGEDEVRRKILVDNNPVSFVPNPDNALLVCDWRADDPGDSELLRVQTDLDSLISRAQETGDYAGGLVAMTEGHRSFCERLEALGARIEAGPPEGASIEELREVMKSVQAECHDIKLAQLGRAP